LTQQQTKTINHFFELVKQNDSDEVKRMIVDQKDIDWEIRFAHTILMNFEMPSVDQYKIDSTSCKSIFECVWVTVIFTRKTTTDKRFINGEIEFFLVHNAMDNKIESLFVGDNDTDVNDTLPELEIDSSSKRN